MGEPPVGHFAVRIDPYRIFSGGDSLNGETFQLMSNLENTNFHQPYLIISTPESGTNLESFQLSAQIFEDNLDLRYEPMVIQLQGDLDDPVEFLTTHQKLFTEIDRGDDLDQDVPVTIIGHSGFNPSHRDILVGSQRRSSVILGKQIHLDTPSVLDQEALDKIEELSGVSVTLEQIDNARTEIIDNENIDSSTLSFSERIEIENRVSEILFSEAKDEVNSFNGDRLFSFVTYSSESRINPRESAPLGCSEAYQRYNEVQGEVIAEALTEGIIEAGEDKDYHETLLNNGLKLTNTHIRDPEETEILKARMSGQFSELGGLYTGLETGASDTNLNPSGEMGITADSMPYHAIMSVMRSNYPSETQNLDEREILTLAFNEGIVVDCDDLTTIEGEYKEIFC